MMFSGSPVLTLVTAAIFATAHTHLLHVVVIAA